jgi:hypothetical protein
MKIYTVYAQETDPTPMENMILIKEGFSWSAAFLTFFLAFYHRMWVAGCILVAVNLFLSILGLNDYLSAGIVQTLRIGFMIFVGCNFNDLYRYELEKRGYSFCGVVSGKNSEGACSKFIAEMLQRTSFAAGNGR